MTIAPALVVVPTYQEADNIERVLERLRVAAPDAGVLVVDDASPDGTADLAEARGAHVLRRPGKAGLGSAYRAGFEWARVNGFGVAVEMDADLSHDPDDVPRLLAAVDDGADLAIGSRYVPGGATPDWPRRRRLLSRVGNRYAGRMLRLRVRDATAGFRAWRMDLLDAIDLDQVTTDGYGFQIDLTYRASRLGAQIAEVPIVFSDRRYGTSKMSGGIILEALRLVTRWGVRDRIMPSRPGPAVATTSTG